MVVKLWIPEILHGDIEASEAQEPGSLWAPSH